MHRNWFCFRFEMLAWPTELRCEINFSTTPIYKRRQGAHIHCESRESRGQMISHTHREWVNAARLSVLNTQKFRAFDTRAPADPIFARLNESFRFSLNAIDLMGFGYGLFVWLNSSISGWVKGLLITNRWWIDAAQSRNYFISLKLTDSFAYNKCIPPISQVKCMDIWCIYN